MVIGTTILNFGPNPYRSPEFGRGGLAATFSIDVDQAVVLPLSGAFLVEVEHRNSEDTTFTSAGTFAPITADGTYQLDITGLKEIVRFAYSFQTPGVLPLEGVHFLMQPPSWRPY